MLDRYSTFCYDQVGNYALDYMEYFESIRPQLTKANIEASLPEYVSMIFFSTLLAMVSSFLITGSLLLLISGIPGLIISLAISLVISVGCMIGFYIYPSILIKNRASKIKDSLPFATIYMSTLAGTGTSISEIFSIIADLEEYGEISEEAEKINRDIETFGMDVSEALQRAAERTPSEEFKDLIWGINHVITSGGSLRDFLVERSDKLMDDYERRIESYAQQLSLLVEMYITLVIVGSIVFTSMSVVTSSFTSMAGRDIVLIQLAGIFFALPLISGMFILLVRGISPGGIR